MKSVRVPNEKLECLNFVNGEWSRETSASGIDVVSPYTGLVLGKAYQASDKEFDTALIAAVRAGKEWASVSLKERTQVMFRFREHLLKRLDEISNIVSLESGKLVSEASAGLLKGVEVLEYALSLQNLDIGGRMEVSSGVSCDYRRESLGVVAGITPFNFPAMVPMWMIPIALTVGNSFVWKPSDKTPLTSVWIANALQEAGLPKGVFSVLQGGREIAERLCEDDRIQAVGFVGSTAAARAVYTRGTQHGKRVLALGGAKNHIILMPDADKEIAAQGILASFTGCAGQRCMAASVLLAVGEVSGIVDEIVERARSIVLERDMGAIISKESLTRLEKAIETAATRDGASLKVDGRKFAKPPGVFAGGHWLGPTVLDNVQAGTEAACDELFGPILSIVRCPSLSAALQIENANPYGNAAAVFTTSGAVAEHVATHARAGMIGVNIGVPVPREPFSFGGFYDSKFGAGDITGAGGVEFWSRVKKVTTKWTLPRSKNWMN